jgi:ABC-type glycerol-3-phosphate transport system substrate-binding protein
MLGKLKSKKTAAASILLVGGLLISGLVAPAFAAPAQPYKGQTITLQTYSGVPEFDYFKSLMPAFTKKTGIKVNYLQLPVATIDQKIPLQLKAKDSGLDVFFTGSEKISAFVGSGGVPDLNPYINNKSKTAANYNFKDIAPAVEAACQMGGKTYCIAVHTGGALLYYNSKRLA